MGVSYLLDTHVLLWLLAQPSKIPDATRVQLASRASTLLVSSVSAMEVATKTRIGKLPDVGLVQAWSRRMRDLGADDLDLTADAALAAGSMDWAHRDPFDRMLAAQAILEGAVLVTVDSAFDGLPGLRTLTW